MFRNTYMEMYKTAVYKEPCLENLMPHLHNLYSTMGSALQDIQFLISLQMNQRQKHPNPQMYLPSMDMQPLPRKQQPIITAQPAPKSNTRVSESSFAENAAQQKPQHQVSHQRTKEIARKIFEKSIQQKEEKNNSNRVSQKIYQHVERVRAEQKYSPKINLIADKQRIQSNNFYDIFQKDKEQNESFDRHPVIRVNQQMQRKVNQKEYIPSEQSSSQLNFFDAYLKKTKKQPPK